MTRVRYGIGAAAAALTLLSMVEAHATPVTFARSENNTDYLSFAVGGVGDGPADITVSGLSGSIRKAFLYWHGVDLGGDGVYANADVTLDGQNVTGESLGDASTNCWGSGASRAFFADVTSIVDGDGIYTFSPGAIAGHDTNGASLIVLYNDGNPGNNRDLVFFEGNDSDQPQGFPGDADGWSATLNNINYAGGSVFAQMHVGDGQNFTQPDDGTVTFTSAEGVVTIPDSAALFDGNSVPDAGMDRAGNGSLWDIHTFDITGAFNQAGTYSIALAQQPLNDCHSLIVTMIDLAAGAAPCGNGTIDEGEECDPAAEPTGCLAPESCLTGCTCGCDSNSDCNDGVSCTVDTCNLETGACTNDDSQCGCPGTCGDPAQALGTITAVDAGFILRTSVELEDCELCVCDLDNSGEVLANDALADLKYAVGLPQTLGCPEVNPSAAVQ
ncbi:MAG: DUF3344 domain-containing protein [Deltaproteobacteria bacterium]|nr:DUF3344 domain-containing protein [Deltaproteobacteria bacterium]